MDTHIHLQDFSAKNTTDIINPAIETGVDKFVCVSAVESDWEKVAELTERFSDYVIPAFGIHPWYVNKAEKGWENRLEDYLKRFPKALIGEAGLDRFRNEDFESQNVIFSSQIELAKQYQRPLIIHAVKAQEWLEYFWKKLPEKFVFHSYNGKSELLKKIITVDGYVGFNFSILKNKEAEKVLKLVPAEKILLETDGPYQALVKGEESKPENLLELAWLIADIRGDDKYEFAAQVYQNGLEFIK